MQITNEQVKAYEETGLLLLPECFSGEEIEVMKAELPTLFAEDSPRRVVEENGAVVRSVYGSHTTNEVFRRLSKHPRIVQPSSQILDSDVYVYQFKINAKAAFGGDVWDWHQDYVFWRNEDGMPKARVINVAIFLDEVTEFNGPMFFIPGSHREGVIDVPPLDQLTSEQDKQNGNGKPPGYEKSPSWISNLTAKIKYSVDQPTVARLAEKYGIVAPKGPRGSALFFDSNIIHASPHNISPFDRVVVLITYNSTQNIPVAVKEPRPDFLSSRNYQPIVALSDDALLI